MEVVQVESNNEKRMQLRITGRVQGVGFRHFTVRTAEKLGSVNGWVKNESDGSVTVVAEGQSSDLRKLKDAVEDGPRSARVDEIEEQYSDPTGNFNTFTVKY